MNNLEQDQQLKELFQNRPVQLPSVVKARIEDTLSSLPKKSRNYIFRRVAISASAAALAIGIAFSSAFFSETMASVWKQVPGAESVFELTGDLGLKAADHKATKVNQTVESNGIELTITKVLYDGNRISVGYMVESSKYNLEKEDLKPRVEFRVNGDYLVKTSTIGATYEVKNNARVGTIIYNIEKPLPKSFQLGVYIDGIHREKMGDELGSLGMVDGKWKFEIPVKLTTQNHKTFYPHITQKVGDTTIQVDKVIFGTSSFRIGVRLSDDRYFTVYDDKGVAQEFLGADGENKPSIYHYSMTSKSIPSFLTLRFINIAESSEDSNHKGKEMTHVTRALNHLPTQDQPFVFIFGETTDVYQRAIIKKMEFFPDRTLVYFQAVTYEPEKMTLTFKDENGKRYEQKNRTLQFRAKDYNEYVAEYPTIPQNQKLMLEGSYVGPTQKIVGEIKIPLSSSQK